MYEKHHNIIDGIYMLRMPKEWDDIPELEEIEKEDDEGELLSLFRDAKVYDIEDLENFNKPTDNHNIKETIFVIRRNGEYYLCETQGEDYIKFSVNISDVYFVEEYDRLNKLIKLYEKSNSN